jgi:hypothetical protein
MATGSNKLNGKLYKVHTKHDKGVTKTKLYAKDGDSARKLVQKAYGGPDSAHTLANESLHNEIADLVEELISELHAPTPDSATAVFDRKAARLQANTAAHDAIANARAEGNKEDFHNRYPNNDTQHRYNYEGELRNVQAGIAKKGESLSQGAKRLSHWAAKKKAEGKATSEMLGSGRRMVQAGVENERSRVENN